MKTNTHLKNVLNKSCYYLKKNTSNILTVASIVGVIGTTVTAVKATPKALQRIQDEEDILDRPLTKLEVVKTASPAYIPSALFGLCTASCILGMNIHNKYTQASLSSAYGLIDKSFKEYRSKVTELYGDDADNKIRNSIAKDKRKKYNDEYRYGDQLLFYDEYSGRFFRRTMDEVRQAEYLLNKCFAMRGEVVLNEFYSYLGISPIDGGDKVGWSQYAGSMWYNYKWIDFEHILVTAEDGDDPDYQDFYRLIMPVQPTNDYDVF